jgi:PST family polysaccharide transporter
MSRQQSPVVLDRGLAARGLAWTSGAAGLTKLVLPIASAVMIARVVGPRVLGVVALLSLVLTVSEMVRDAGLTMTYLADRKLDDHRERLYMTLGLVGGILWTAVLLASAHLVAWLFAEPNLAWALQWTSAVLLINGIGTIPRAKMLRAGQLKQSGAIDGVSAATGFGVALAFVRSGLYLEGLIAQLLAGSIVASALTFRCRPVWPGPVTLTAARPVLSMSRSVLAANSLNNLFLLSDIFVVQRLLGSTETGLYSVAKNIAYKPAEVVSFPLARTLLAAYSQALDEPGKLGRVFARSIAATILLVTPIYLILGALAEPLITILYGPRFRGAEQVLVVFSVYLAARSLGTLGGSALVPAGKVKLVIYAWLPCLLATAAGVFWLRGDFGAVGIAWAYTVGAIVVYGLVLLLALKFTSPTPKDLLRVRRATAVTLTTAVVVLAIQVLPLPPLGRAALTVAAGPVVQWAGIGVCLQGHPLAFFSLDGPIRFWRTL